MFIKTKISACIHGYVKQLIKSNTSKSHIYCEQFATSDKALATTLIMQFSSTKLTGIGGVRDHIMRMRDILTQLKTLEVTMSKTFLVHFLLNTLPQQYSPFKISYYT